MAEKRRKVLAPEEIAAMVGASRRTVYEWSQRAMKQEVLDRRSTSPEVEMWTLVDVAEFTLGKRGTWGTQATRREFPSVSRRLVREGVKLGRRLLAQYRKGGWIRVEWVAPDVAWSMDFFSVGGHRLVALGDECSRYQLGWELRESWDAEAVAAWLEGQFARWGAPLVVKRDNEAILGAPPVAAVLARWGVLDLPSPVRRPRYNGKRERGMGDLRAWLRGISRNGHVDPDELAAEIAAAMKDLNERPRPILQGRCSREVYMEARRIAIDRWGLVRRVEERKRRVLASRSSIAMGGETDGKLQRRAVVEEMKDQGLVKFGTEDGGEGRTSMWASAAAEHVN